jgi:hypothetical protein
LEFEVSFYESREWKKKKDPQSANQDEEKPRCEVVAEYGQIDYDEKGDSRLREITT